MSTRWTRAAVGGVLLGLLGTGLASAQDADDRSILRGGDWWAQLRYRFETVDVDSPLKTANASTLRTRIGAETNTQLPISVLVEGEDVHSIGDDRYNSTTNGRTEYAVVADPEATQINQAYVTVRG